MSKVYIETERCKLGFNRMRDVLIEEGRGKAYENGQPDPTYRNRPIPDFFHENIVLFVGVFIIEVSILKKTQEPTLF